MRVENLQLHKRLLRTYPNHLNLINELVVVVAAAAAVEIPRPYLCIAVVVSTY